MKTFRTIAVSDVHLGSAESNASHLDKFLKKHSCETLYLIGDIFDGWKIQNNSWQWKQSHFDVVQTVIDLSFNTRVFYILGNHDEFLRPFVNFGLTFGNITILNETMHICANGAKFLIVHGDMFDGITNLAPWLAKLGDSAYSFLISANSIFNQLRHQLGYGYWSLSKFLKFRVKTAVDYLFQFEKNLIEYAKSMGYDGVMCGHIHHAEIKRIDNLWYMNSGDWVESCTALVETHDGIWKILMLNSRGEMEVFKTLERNNVI